MYKSAHMLNNQTFKIETPKNTMLRPSSFDLVNISILGKIDAVVSVLRTKFFGKISTQKSVYFFCQINVEISNSTLKYSTKQCAMLENSKFKKYFL